MDLEQEYAIILLPKDTVEVEIRAKIYHGGEIKDVKKTMNIQDVRDAFKEAEEGYIPSNAIFHVTEKGLKYLEGLDG